MHPVVFLIPPAVYLLVKGICAYVRYRKGMFE